jgi:hypothetical protein
MSKEIDYLTEDEPIYGQKWVCLSFLSPEGIRNCKVRGIKVRGVYDTKEEADARAKQLQDIDPDFHIFVGEVGKWLSQDPDPNSITDQQYREKELNKLMKDYKSNLSKAKQMEAERKNELLQDALVSERNKRSTVRDRLRRKLDEKQAKKDVEELKNISKSKSDDDSKVKELLENEQIAKKEQTRLEANTVAVQKAEENVTKIDDNINKIQELYNSLLKKRQEQPAST